MVLIPEKVSDTGSAQPLPMSLFNLDRTAGCNDIPARPNWAISAEPAASFHCRSQAGRQFSSHPNPVQMVKLYNNFYEFTVWGI